MMQAVKSRTLILAFCAVVLASASYAVIPFAWDNQPTGTTQDIRSIYFLNNAYGLAVGNNNTLLKTDNAGIAWTAKTSGLTNSPNFNDVIIASSTEGFICGDKGAFLKITDTGESFVQINITGLENANFKKISIFGNTAAAIATTQEAGGTNTYILLSTGGSPWVGSVLTSFEGDGVLLTSGTDVWIWGKNLSGPNVDKYTILHNSTEETTVANKINDVFYVEDSSGVSIYAAQSGGYITKGTAASSSGPITWQAPLFIGGSEDLNAAYFISHEFGWVVGTGSLVVFTTDGGTTWTAYQIPDTTDIKDISIKAQIIGEFALIQGYICGTGGKIYRLSSPTISSVDPNSKKQGWVGTIAIAGTGFLAGAETIFTKPGTTEPDPEMVVANTSFESGTGLTVPVVISPEATLGSRDIYITNIDSTTTGEAGVFNITANLPGAVVFKSVFIGAPPSHKSYIEPTDPASPETNMTSNSALYFTVEASAGITKEGSNAKLIIRRGDLWSIYNIPTADITEDGSTRIHVATQVPAVFLDGEIFTLDLYAEDNSGNVGRKALYLQAPVGTGSTTGPLGYTGLDTTGWDVENTPLKGAYIRLKKGVILHQVKVQILNNILQEIWSQEFKSATGFTNQLKWTISGSNLPPYLTPGLYTLLATTTDAIAGAQKIGNLTLVARNLILIAPSSMIGTQ